MINHDGSMMDTENLTNEIRTALSSYLLALADDELLLGHRDSEWCGHAPILEEDIAFANLALDEIGHSSLWYSLLAGLNGQDDDAYADQLVYKRQPEAFRCCQLVELPNGDWAFSLLRQYLFDAAERVRLDGLAKSSYQPIAGAAEKIRKEEIYHQRHTQAWVRRLGLGTEESHRRMQQALDELWPYALQIFTPLQNEVELVKAHIVPDSAELRAAWEEKVILLLQDCGLVVPPVESLDVPRDQHSPEFKVMVEELQSVARMDPHAAW